MGESLRATRAPSALTASQSGSIPVEMPNPADAHLFYLISSVVLLAWWLVALELREARAKAPPASSTHDRQCHRRRRGRWGLARDIDVEAQRPPGRGAQVFGSPGGTDSGDGEGKAARALRAEFGPLVPDTILEDDEESEAEAEAEAGGGV